jgi:gliding motility-associated-like protein
VTAVSCKDETDGRIAIRPKGGTPGYSVLWSNGETALTIDELRGATYSVVLTDAQSCKYEAEFEVPVTPEACITPVGVPNTFTPNGDDYNDLWVINHYEEYPEMEVAVFDRWGQRVFYSKGYEKPWDGTYQNQIVPPGVYYYTIKLNNGDAPFTGTLTIIR